MVLKSIKAKNRVQLAVEHARPGVATAWVDMRAGLLVG